MIPNAADIARRQWTCQSVIRAFAFILFVSSLIPLISWLAEGIADGDYYDMFYYADRIALSIALIILSGILLLFQRHIARLLVPIVRYTRCPACRYRIEGLIDPLCPECGLPLTEEFLNPTSPVPAQAPHLSYHVIENRRHILASIFRALGVLFLLYALLVFLAGFMYLFVEADRYDYLSTFIIVFLQSVLLLVSALILLLRNHRLARFCIHLPKDCIPPLPDHLVNQTLPDSPDR